VAKSPSRASAGKSSSSASKKKAATTKPKVAKAAPKAKAGGSAKASKAANASKAASPGKSAKAPKASAAKPAASKASKPVVSAKKGVKAVAPKAGSASSSKSSTKSAAKASKKPPVKTAAKGEVGGKASGRKLDKKAPAKTEKKSAASTKVDKKGKPAKAVSEPKKPAGKTTKSSSGRSRSGSKEPANPRSVAAAAVSRSEAGDSGGYMFINGRRVRMISTKGLAIPKRAKAAPVEEVAPEVEAERIRAIKTKLSESELTKYRELLLEKRRELVGVVNVMEEEALRSSGGNLSNMPLHMADVGSDTYDQDFTLGMAEAERRLLSEIDAAIGRIADRSYGVCQMTGKPIPKVRLNAKPWAKYTIEAARLVEAGQAR
jgi:DnaK suppressor protein